MKNIGAKGRRVPAFLDPPMPTPCDAIHLTANQHKMLRTERPNLVTFIIFFSLFLDNQNLYHMGYRQLCHTHVNYITSSYFSVIVKDGL